MYYRDKTILVTAVSGDIGAAAVRSLHGTGIRIIGCDVNPCSPVRELLAELHSVPPAGDSSYLGTINSLTSQNGVDFLFPISEPEIKVLHGHRGELALPVENILLNNQVILDHFLDKLHTNRYLAALDIPVPKTTLLGEFTGDWPYPLVVKSRQGWGSKNLWLVEDKADLDYLHRKDDGSLIVQECIGKPEAEYTTGVFSDGENVSAISFRRRLGFGGLSIEAVLDDHQGLHELARRIALTTGLIGSINIQSRRLGDRFYTFEINPRLSSTLLFRKHFGFDDVVWWLETVAGRKYSYRKRYLAGRAFRCTAEFYADLVAQQE